MDDAGDADLEKIDAPPHDPRLDGGTFAAGVLALALLAAGVVFLLVPVVTTVVRRTREAIPVLVRVISEKSVRAHALTIRKVRHGVERTVIVAGGAEKTDSVSTLFDKLPPASGRWVAGPAPAGVDSVELSLNSAKCHVVLQLPE